MERATAGAIGATGASGKTRQIAVSGWDLAAIGLGSLVKRVEKKGAAARLRTVQHARTRELGSRQLARYLLPRLRATLRHLTVL